MNMQSIMAQAQKMKKDIEKKQNEIDSKEFISESEFVTIKMNGKRELQKLKINKNLITDAEDVDVLEDMITVAIKDILKQIETEYESKMGMYGSGLSGLM